MQNEAPSIERHKCQSCYSNVTAHQANMHVLGKSNTTLHSYAMFIQQPMQCGVLIMLFDKLVTCLTLEPDRL